jgi:hypothetical protein
MSKINAIYNIDSKELNIVETDPNPFHTDLLFSFTSNSDTEILNIKGIAFGFDTLYNGSKFYPPHTVEYNSAMKDSIFERAEWSCIPETDYTVKIWVEFNGQKTEVSHMFTSPRPKAIYPSWVWDAEAKVWNPPIPMPEGPLKQWSETENGWIDILADFPALPADFVPPPADAPTGPGPGVPRPVDAILPPGVTR